MQPVNDIKARYRCSCWTANQAHSARRDWLAAREPALHMCCQDQASAKFHVIDFWGYSHIMETKVTKLWMPAAHCNSTLLQSSWVVRGALECVELFAPTLNTTRLLIFSVFISPLFAFSVCNPTRQLFLFALPTFSSLSFHSGFIIIYYAFGGQATKTVTFIFTWTVSKPGALLWVKYNNIEIGLTLLQTGELGE